MYVEYLALTILLALPVAVAVVQLGTPLVRFHRYTQLSLVAPLP